ATLSEALALLGRYGDEAKVLAGSQSLVPLMKLRLAQPAHLVDLRKVEGLTGVREAQGALLIGALTTHAALASSELIRQKLPPARAAGAYEKLPNPASRFAVVGVAAEVSLDSGNAVQWARVALTGLASKVTRAAKVEQALQGKAADASTVKAASARAAEGLELRADLTGSAAYKAQLAAVYTERAVLRAISRARE